MYKNMVAALFLTERDTDEFDENAPKVRGRIITTLQKAKEIRPNVERCITIARKGLAAEDAARPFGTTADRGSSAYKSWREGDQWKSWAKAMAPIMITISEAAENRVRKPTMSPTPPKNSPIVTR